jgi:hypothetical protein
VKRFDNFAASYAPYASAPWLWLGLTYLLIAVGALVLYGGADYPGLFADSPGAVEGGRERDAAIEEWHDRYFDVGVPFAIAAVSTTLAWMIALRQRWVVIAAVAAALILALVPFVEQAVALVVVFLLPAILLLFIPWQAAALALAGAALTALAVKPPRERLGIHLAALYLALTSQALFSTLSLTIARGTFG